MTVQNVPLDIPIGDLLAAANSDGAAQIPLTLISVGTNAYKVALRVKVALTDNGTVVSDNGKDGRLYEFDTGGNGFWLDGSDMTLPSTATETSCIQYFSGKTYVAKASPAKISFPGATVPPKGAEPSIDAVVGVIQQYYDCPPGQKTDPDPTPMPNPPPCSNGTFPIFKECFGDFGAALSTAGKEFSGTASIMTVLAQYAPPTTLDSGFIVAAPQPSGKPGYLILGVGPALRGLFPQTVAMVAGAAPYIDPYDTSVTFPTYSEQLIDGTLGVNQLSVGTGFCMDTGAPVTTLHGGTVLTIGPNENPNYQANSGDKILLTAPNTQSTEQVPLPDVTVLALTADKPDTVTNVDSSKNSSNCTQGYINTGLALFLQCPVMYDLSRKVVGFPPAIIYN